MATKEDERKKKANEAEFDEIDLNFEDKNTSEGRPSATVFSGSFVPLGEQKIIAPKEDIEYLKSIFMDLENLHKNINAEIEKKQKDLTFTETRNAMDRYREDIKKILTSSPLALSDEGDPITRKEALVTVINQKLTALFNRTKALEVNPAFQASGFVQKNAIRKILSNGIAKIFKKLNADFPDQFPEPVPGFFKSPEQKLTATLNKLVETKKGELTEKLHNRKP